jgi:hypothetical protein
MPAGRGWLATPVHETVHLWQHHFGTLSRTGYHNKEWATMMKAVGLIPSDTDTEAGKETGQHVSHYIQVDGMFDRAYAELVTLGFIVPYVELWAEGEEKTRKKKAASKTKYTCPGCGLNAWAKPDVSLLCGECEVALLVEDGEDNAL